jgi:hypothetical protein
MKELLCSSIALQFFICSSFLCVFSESSPPCGSEFFMSECSIHVEFFFLQCVWDHIFPMCLWNMFFIFSFSLQCVFLCKAEHAISLLSIIFVLNLSSLTFSLILFAHVIWICRLKKKKLCEWKNIRIIITSHHTNILLHISTVQRFSFFHSQPHAPNIHKVRTSWCGD